MKNDNVCAILKIKCFVSYYYLKVNGKILDLQTLSNAVDSKFNLIQKLKKKSMDAVSSI